MMRDQFRLFKRTFLVGNFSSLDSLKFRNQDRKWRTDTSIVRSGNQAIQLIPHRLIIATITEP